MIEVLSESRPRARKMHNCSASDFILEHGFYGFTFGEYRLIAKAKKVNFMIEVGDIYINQNNKFEGDIYTFKAIPAMHDICIKHDLYES